MENEIKLFTVNKIFHYFLTPAGSTIRGHLSCNSSSGPPHGTNPKFRPDGLSYLARTEAAVPQIVQ